MLDGGTSSWLLNLPKDWGGGGVVVVIIMIIL